MRSSVLLNDVGNMEVILNMDDKLREEMARLYMEGRYDESLKLSRKLDKEILKYYKKGKNKQNQEAIPKKTVKLNTNLHEFTNG